MAHVQIIRRLGDEHIVHLVAGKPKNVAAIEFQPFGAEPIVELDETPLRCRPVAPSSPRSRRVDHIDRAYLKTE